MFWLYRWVVRPVVNEFAELWAAVGLLRTLGLSYMRRRLTRTAMIAVSIALGVGALIGTRALADNLKDSGEVGMNPLSDLADLVVANGGAGIPGSLVQEIRRSDVDGLQEVYPVDVGHVNLPQLNNRSTLMIGVDWTDQRTGEEADYPWGSFKMKASDAELLYFAVQEWAPDLFEKAPPALPPPFPRLGPLTRRIPAVLDDELFKKMEADLGAGTRQLDVQRGGKPQQVRVLGTVKLKGKAGEQVGPGLIVLPLRDASRLLFPERQDYVYQIFIKLAPGADRARAQERLQSLVGDQGEVVTVEDNNRAVRDISAGLELGFTLGAAGALVVGLFLVYNALSVSVAERRRDIGIMRSLGATRGQVAWLFRLEAMLLGLVGAAAGLPLGYVLARIAVGPMRKVLSEAFLPLPEQPVVLSWGTMLFAALAGVATAVAAAAVPAYQASREEPAHAVRQAPKPTRAVYQLLRLAVCLLLVGGGFAMVALRELLPRRAGAFAGIVSLMLGALAATPLLASALGRLFRPLFGVLFGLEGRLAADNLVRSPGRTGLVIAALAATGGLLMQTAGFIYSSETAILTWLDEQVGADLFVTAGVPISGAAGVPLPMDEGKYHLRSKLQELPHVQTVLPICLRELRYRKDIVFLVALDSDAFKDHPETNELARLLERYRRQLRPEGGGREGAEASRSAPGGTALVSENFAALYGVKPGQNITIKGPRGPLTLKVLGTAVDYTWNRGTVIVDREWYRREFRDDTVDVYDVFLKPEAGQNEQQREEVRQQVSRVLEAQPYRAEHALFVKTRPQYRNALTSILQRVYGLAYAQQVIIAQVALLFVVSALFISVLQRRRELGLLRAVGATRGQILRSVLAEAMLMGLIGAIAGFLIGLLLEWYVLRILILDEAGFVFPMLVPWWACGLVAGMSVALATLVGLWPAYHATQLRIAEAIAYE
jgi:putative ABC transport system permease protein